MIKKKTPVKKSTPKTSLKTASPAKMASGEATSQLATKKMTVKKAVPSKQAKTPEKKAVVKKPLMDAPAVKDSVPKEISKSADLKVAPKTISLKKAPVKNKTSVLVESRGVLRQTFVKQPLKQKKDEALSPFLAKQRVRLLMLKDTLLDSMKGVARDNLHAGSETSGFGMHQADAGSDAYDRDFALSILSQEQNSLYEIDEALKRINDGTYGVCEISNKQIPRARLEARPFTRYTVECQADLEKRQHVTGTRLAVSALFGLTEEESENDDDENLLETTKD